MRRRLVPLAPLAALVAATAPALAAAQTVVGATFVNGLALDGATTDLGSGYNRFGFFSDLYYDAGRNEWWALADRGPGGGTQSYGTRASRFTLDVDLATGAISNFQLRQTIQFTEGGLPLDGATPNAAGTLGRALDPEGFVVNPLTGTFLVSDEYGPSLVETDRTGAVLRRFVTPDNLVPRNGAGGPLNYADNTNTVGRTFNRGFEGLAISPDGRYAYAMLQSGMANEGGGNGLYSRIVKFDVLTGTAVAQYAYPLDNASAGRGISALVALGGDRFLVLERNNRGIGVGATLTTPDKLVYEIDLAGATDVSTTALTNGVLPPGTQTVTKVARPINLAANTLAALGNRVPEKWEGLAIGPQLADGRYLILAGTDNDFSVTQSGNGPQLDLYFNVDATNPNTSAIQCPQGQTTGCTLVGTSTPATLTAQYKLLPGVLHAYAATLAPEPATLGLVATGLGALVLGARRRRDRA